MFIDVDTIQPGDDFRDVITQAVANCDVLIAVIDSHWKGQDATGTSRLDSEHDFIRIEVGAALERGVKVVPFLYKDARMPTAEELPTDLRRLTQRHALRVRDETWDADIRRLLGSIRSRNQSDQTAHELKTPTSPGSLPETTRPHPSPGTVQSQGRLRRIIGWALLVVGLAEIVLSRSILGGALFLIGATVTYSAYRARI